jgi:isocitrate dehydrogenase
MPEHQKMMASPAATKEQIVGVDVFIESELLASEIAESLKPKLRQGFKLVNISNRGTQVWPTGSNFTECVNQYCLRFEVTRKDAELEAVDMFAFVTVLSSRLKISSVEILKTIDDKKGYVLAQGQ